MQATEGGGGRPGRTLRVGMNPNPTLTLTWVGLNLTWIGLTLTWVGLTVTLTPTLT